MRADYTHTYIYISTIEVGGVLVPAPFGRKGAEKRAETELHRTEL